VIEARTRTLKRKTAETTVYGGVFNDGQDAFEKAGVPPPQTPTCAIAKFFTDAFE